MLVVLVTNVTFLYSVFLSIYCIHTYIYIYIWGRSQDFNIHRLAERYIYVFDYTPRAGCVYILLILYNMTWSSYDVQWRHRMFCWWAFKRCFIFWCHMYVETNVAAAALRRCSCRVLICGFLSVAARISFVRLELLKKLARASSARCSIVKTVVSICLEYGFLAQLGMLNLVGDCNTQMAPPNNPVPTSCCSHWLWHGSYNIPTIMLPYTPDNHVFMPTRVQAWCTSIPQPKFFS